jgi:hypothetical protein
MLPFLLALLAQVTPVQPIVKGTGLPPADSEEAQVMAPLDAWFAGVDAGDADRVAAQLRLEGGGGATVAAVGADGGRAVRHLGWPQFLAGVGPRGARHHEQFTGTPAVEIDGDIAMVWGDVRRTIDGKVASCGVNHFDLIREGAGWKVQNITFSQRLTGCDG